MKEEYSMTEEDKALLDEAARVRGFAYAPYSNFKVGAAIRTKDGKMYGGCNIENSSFSSTMCAERTAIYRAVSSGETEFDTIAVVSDSPNPAAPCGSCLQVLAEFGVSRIIMSNLNGDTEEMTIGELLPKAFSKENME